MAAKRKPIEAKTVADLGIDPASVGAAGALEQVAAIAKVTEEKQGVKITDDGSGDSVDAIVDFLKKIQVA